MGVRHQIQEIPIGRVLCVNALQQPTEASLRLAAYVLGQMAPLLLRMAAAELLAHVISIDVDDAVIVLGFLLAEAVDLERERIGRCDVRIFLLQVLRRFYCRFRLDGNFLRVEADLAAIRTYLLMGIKIVRRLPIHLAAQRQASIRHIDLWEDHVLIRFQFLEQLAEVLLEHGRIQIHLATGCTDMQAGTRDEQVFRERADNLQQRFLCYIFAEQQQCIATAIRRDDTLLWLLQLLHRQLFLPTVRINAAIRQCFCDHWEQLLRENRIHEIRRPDIRLQPVASIDISLDRAGIEQQSMNDFSHKFPSLLC